MTTQSAKGLRGVRVYGGKNGNRQIGKIIHPLCHPSEPRIVGFLVKRPDALLMIKREDRFLALDCAGAVQDGLGAVGYEEAWDDLALVRLGIRLDDCRLLEGVEVWTEEGRKLGTVDDVSFQTATGDIVGLVVSEGTVAASLLGKRTLPPSCFRGFQGASIIVSGDAADEGYSGGVAEKAAQVSSKVSAKARESAKNAGAKAGEKLDEGARALGSAIGKTKQKLEEATAEGGVLDKQKERTRGMFAAFKEEYKKGLSGEE